MLAEQKEIFTINCLTEVLRRVNELNDITEEESYDLATAVATSLIMTCIKTSFQLSEEQTIAIHDKLEVYMTELIEEANEMADNNDRDPFSQN